ncbi:hypothetical protein BRPE67_ACDS09480 [Caballeronia cordobensis]|nr:hypothetical protein BRPE67_ACDS09480 [Burkholderia sp. RPE67]
MARRRNVPTSSAEIAEAIGRKLNAARDRAKAAAEIGPPAPGRQPIPEVPPLAKLVPRAALSRLSPKRIERLLQAMENGPTEAEVELIATKGVSHMGRWDLAFPEARSAYEHYKSYYAERRPGEDPETLPELVGMRVLINALRKRVRADGATLDPVMQRFNAAFEAREELAAIQSEFNELINVYQKRTP